MRLAATVLGISVMTSAAHAEVFDPRVFGLSAETVVDEEPARPAINCIFKRNAVDGGRNKVWSCDDGVDRFGPDDVWSRKGPPVMAPEAVLDPAVILPAGKTLLTITTNVDGRHCSSGKHRHCYGRDILSYSYLLLDDRAVCEHLGPRLSARQWVDARARYEDVQVEWDCDGGDKAPAE